MRLRLLTTCVLLAGLLVISGCKKEQAEDAEVKALMTKLMRSMQSPKGLISAEIKNMNDRSNAMAGEVDPQAKHAVFMKDQFKLLIESRQEIAKLFASVSERFGQARANQLISELNAMSGPLFGNPSSLENAQVEIDEDEIHAKASVLGVYAPFLFIKRDGRWYFDADGMYENYSAEDLQQMQEISQGYVEVLKTLSKMAQDKEAVKDYQALVEIMETELKRDTGKEKA